MIAVFGSRSETFRFYNKMATLGARVKTVPAPKYIGTSCALAVQFDSSKLYLAKSVLVTATYQTFKGFF